MDNSAKYKQLVILSIGNYDKRISEMFEVPYLLENGIKIEYWDVSDITLKGYKLRNYSPPGGLVISEIHSKTIFKERILDKKNDSIFIIYMDYGSHSYFCYRLLSKYHCKYIYYINGVLPSVSVNIQTSFCTKLRKINIQLILQKLRALSLSTALKTPLIRPVDYLLVSCGSASAKGRCKIGKNTIVVPCNSLDYQSFLHLSTRSDRLLEQGKRYMVFLDQNIPFHPDHLLSSGDPMLDADFYFSSMCMIFGLLEKTYNCEVVIAAHPSVRNVTEYQAKMGNRKFFFDKTMDLIENSIGAITHYSTAISYSVLFKKKMFFIFSEEMKKIYRSQYFLGKEMCKKLDGVFICPENMDKMEMPLDLSVNNELYEKYKYDYIVVKGNDEKSNGNILLRLLTR